MRLRVLRFALVLSVSVLLCPGCAETEKTEEVTAEITAAQMEGRRAAGRILGPEWTDTAKLQRALIEEKAKQSEYVIAGKSKCAAAYDSAFLSTIKTVNPDLAKKLTPDQQ